ncbi:hypothetical protein FJZ31_07550 [Candidatus Poribacteria bacterium]|nr:hypothetical protein [Candidatus Poribacteria bacterium]
MNISKGSFLLWLKKVRGISKGFYWTILVIVFGLMQFWIKLAYLYYTEPDKISFYNVTKDGVLLFFTLAITMSVTMDYHFDDQLARVGTLFRSTAFTFMPFMVMSFVIMWSVIISTSANTNKELSSNLNKWAFILSVVYAICGKSFLFSKNRLESSTEKLNELKSLVEELYQNLYDEMDENAH